MLKEGHMAKAGSFNLTARITLMVGSMVALILGAVIAVIGIRLSKDVKVIQSEANAQIVAARAAELGRLLDSYYWQLRGIAAQDFLLSADRVAAEQHMLKTIIKDVSPDVGTSLLVWDNGWRRSRRGATSTSQNEATSRLYAGEADYVIADVAISKVSNTPVVILAKAIVDKNGGPGDWWPSRSRWISFRPSRPQSSWANRLWMDFRPARPRHRPSDEGGDPDVNTLDSTKDGYKGLDALGRLMLAQESGESGYPPRTEYR
jgi:hypothetical protein